MEKILHGNVAVVTGAARGIGRGIAIELAKEGAYIVVADLNESGSEETAEMIRNLGGQAFVVPGDVTEPNYQQELVNSTLRSYGSIDTLINNAALVDFGRDIVLNPSEVETRRVWEVNYHAPRQLSHLVAKEMVATKTPGSIIFLTSVHAHLVRMQEHYHGAKSALEALMREMAVQYGGYGIRVNAIAPGSIHEKANATLEELKSGHFADETALRRRGLPSEIGKAAVFLASPYFSSYVTASTIPVNGGIIEYNWVTKQFYQEN